MQVSDNFLDSLSFSEDVFPVSAQNTTPDASWKVLIVDDEPSIHDVTRLALSDTLFDNRPLDFLSAFSAQEAFETLQNNPDIAVIFLDVVMETENAGLTLVERIRQELGNKNVRIVLRTGQPGYAPERSVIAKYDINDYKEKSELTADRLYVTFISALRNYRDICEIQKSRDSLQFIVDSMAQLASIKLIAPFSQSLLRCLFTLISPPSDQDIETENAGMVVAAHGNDFDVLYGSGQFEQCLGLHDLSADIQNLLMQDNPEILRLVDQKILIHIRTQKKISYYILLTSPHDLSPIYEKVEHLLLLVVRNSILLFENINLMQALRSRAQDAESRARTDSLTNLPNRLGLMYAWRILAAGGSNIPPLPSSLSLIDLNRFKDVNDTYGHNVGDKLLCEVAKRIRLHSQPTDIVCRMAGDEFAILHPNQTADGVYNRIEQIISHLRDPFYFDGYEINIGSSAGIADLIPPSTNDKERNEQESVIGNALRLADIALFTARQARTNRPRIFDPNLEKCLREERNIEKKLRLALLTLNNKKPDTWPLCLNYQPKVDMRTGEIIGAEALIRWKDKEHNISPHIFIPIAERTGMIGELGTWIIDQAFRQSATWHKAGKPLRIAINLSPVQFRDHRLCQIISDCAEKWGVQAEWIEFEITETAAMGNVDETLVILTRLRNMGFDISIDDFGTGYSSLNYLRRLPASTIKIDRSFVHDLNSSDEAKAIVKTILSLAKSLNLKVVGEGVEQQEQANFLLENGCMEGQGYLWGHAVPAEIF